MFTDSFSLLYFINNPILMGEILRKRVRKAISPIIATLLLVSISIAGVLIVYRFMSTVLTSSANVIGLQVVDKQLKVLSDGSAAFYISAKNIGNTELDVVEIRVGEYVENFTTPVKVRPGDTFTYNTVITSITFEVGKEYPLIIKATLPDGSEKVFQEIVRGE
ncbi:MAG: hypothetical protein DRO23_05170 [Thermoprotei archaeon]|nr:MAG: hypothetical protein DRO23_05170 [Thermoprotei archaeon]